MVLRGGRCLFCLMEDTKSKSSLAPCMGHDGSVYINANYDR
jgi:hypothetical protein